MALDAERSKLMMIAFGVTSSLTCLAFICLMIFGLITITNSPNSQVSYNVGAAEIVFAIGSFLLCMSGIAGMLILAIMMRKSSSFTKDPIDHIHTTSIGQPTITTIP